MRFLTSILSCIKAGLLFRYLRIIISFYGHKKLSIIRITVKKYSITLNNLANGCNIYREKQMAKKVRASPKKSLSSRSDNMPWAMATNALLRSSNRCEVVSVHSMFNVIYHFSKCNFSGVTGSESWVKRLRVDVRKFLPLNSDETKILVIAPAEQRHHVDNVTVTLDNWVISQSSTVKNLGVTFDSILSFDHHIKEITKIAFYHLRNIAKIRSFLSTADAEILIHAYIFSLG